ncbi:MAG: hypothetical protein JSW67_12360 [Candidatus Latescibacterota bacterium]|nr:MAG: hypothetical protein JSW67_12360 [Candidatus Latescibacterota bacterium]
MQTTEILAKVREGKSVDEYLGYQIHEVSGWFLAIPRGWKGEILEAASMPRLRRKIWRWWYQLPT